jgi:ribose/xylose/arabinose/galactoside ABC-type transport system permease subunit
MTLYAVVIFAVVLYILNRSRYGQQLFLTGNNKNAAYLTGSEATWWKSWPMC